MQINPENINELIRSRRTTTPDFFQKKTIEPNIIKELLENATWAPNHKMTQPWRFKVFTGKALERLGDHLANYYKEHTPEVQFSEVKYQKNKAKATNSAAVIIICMQRSQQIEIPEWEELAATACAVENFWISTTAYGLGGYWSSTEAIINAEDFLQLKEGERCLGLFYLGYPEPMEDKRKRAPLEEKVEWVEE